MRNLTAFTLIELLVVVTIIVILLALLTPSLDKALQAAEQVRCAANLHGSALQCQMYMADFKGRLMPSDGQAPGGQPPQDGNHWWYKEFLKRYGTGTSTSLYICPSDIGWPGSGISSDRPLHSNPNWAVSHYLSISNDLGAVPNLRDRKVRTLRQQSKTVLMCDWPAYVGFSWHPYTPEAGLNYNNGLNNYSFLDGHVARLPTYWAGGWSVTYYAKAPYEHVWLAPEDRP